MGPMWDEVFRTGQATWSEDFLYVMNRSIPREETYFTFSYSAIRDDNGSIGGIFCACNDTTARVLSERRLRTLRDLNRMETEVRTVETTCEIAAGTLGENRHDIPFALIYLLDGDTRQAQLLAASAINAGGSAAPLRIDLDDASDSRSNWPLREVLETGVAQVVDDVSSRFGSLPGGPWPESPETALVVPIAAPEQKTAATGFLISGLSPRRLVDSDYLSFLNLVAGQIGTSVANARAAEAERKRAAALAEIDRAKTLFFSNVSHEFRTPLTLMLGPLEDALASGELPSKQRERLDTAHRNSLRLLKLVNSLLDFSRIEAGRAQANYTPTDLADITTNFASNFRSACDRAGLEFVVDCQPLGEPVYVDRDMWEKIVLNLLSNAFKFTFEGEIAVCLRVVDGHAELSVRDTGVGIPARELPRLFERFHRIEGQKSRTYEGSGIGLALVQELVKLHGGAIRAESVEGQGTRFIVTIPLGRSHLAQDRIGVADSGSSTAVRAGAYIEEALRWLPDDAAPVAGTLPPSGLSRTTPPQLEGARILVADDNADMRDYVRRLLEPYCDVETVADGQAALDTIRKRPPDLVLSDVMMPRVDGLGLVRTIRSEPALADIPVVLLSARAGEEAEIEGLNAGADDYLIKPFSARELLAPVGSNLNLAKLRGQVAADLKDTKRLREMANALIRAGNGFKECLDDVLEAAIEITRADKGNIQVLDPKSDMLVLTSQRGFEEPFLNFFTHVKRGEAAVCGTAPQALERIVVEDVTQSEIFVGQESLGVLLDAGVRAVQSTPLLSSSGTVLGMISTHYCGPYRPSERELRFMELLARQAADYLERKQIEQEQVRAESTRRLLLDELNHRVKNTLASVQAIAQQTVRSTKDPADFATRFSGRIQSMARVHSLLTDSTWRGADLRELTHDQLLRGAVDNSKLTAWGPAVRLEPQIAVHVAVMLHELGTNSVKYGALSVAKGWVTVNWSVAGDVLNLQWVERGGPMVSVPAKRGFGTTLIEQSAKSEGGNAEQLFEPEGITWKISLTLPHADAGQQLVRPPPEFVTPATRRDATAKPALRLSALRLLIVEDESLIALDLVARLELAGADVAAPVSTEKQALRVIEDGHFDCALLDANLHGRPVHEIAAALTRRKIPFVFITGYGRTGLPTSFQQAPVLSKPVNDEQLLDAITGVVPRSRKILPLKP
jgi:signal transduction histidine kinase/CheY-like chemotaxis protein